MSDSHANLATVRRYLAALEEGATGSALASFFTGDIVQIEHPNRLKPGGDRRDHSTMGRDAKTGAQILARQSYDVRNALAQDDRVAIEVRWEGVMAVDAGALRAGSTLVVHSAMFFTFQGGKIASQHNFDCVEPF